MKSSDPNPQRRFQINIVTLLLVASFCGILVGWWHDRRQLHHFRASHDVVIEQLQKLHSAKGRLERALERERREISDDEPVRFPLFLEADQVGIEYLAHSCFRIYSPGDTRIVIDPWASNVWLGYDRPRSVLADPVDAVLITHPHYDHDAGEFIGRLVNWPSEAQIIRDPGYYTVGDVQVQGIQGKHAAGMGKEFGQKNTIFLLEIAGLRIVHLGDNKPLTNSTVESLGRVDILMIPIDAEEHLLKDHEIEAIRHAIAPRVLIPMHYRHPDLEIDPTSPTDLGPIDPWLTGQVNVLRLDRHTAVFSATSLTSQNQIVVFQHSPIVKRPDALPTFDVDGPGEGFARLSPFTDLRYEVDDKVLVEYDGQWYQLVSIDDLSTSLLLQTARETFEQWWQLRFAEDLVEVMEAAGKRPTTTVKLVLEQSGNVITVEKAPMTVANRQLVKRNYRRWLGDDDERD